MTDRTYIRIAGAAVLAALAFAATSLDSGPRSAMGAVVCLISFALMIISRRQLGGSFSMMPEAKPLVTKGLYARIQHPMYLFLDLSLLGAIAVLRWPVLLLGWGVLVVLQAWQARREERALATAFGADYEAYRSRTWF